MAYWIVKLILTPVLRIVYRVRIEGREHLPREGAVILASNHRSFLDSIFIPMVVRRRVTFVAKAEYFDDPKTAWFFRAVGQIPIRREGGTASEGALAAATDVLRDGGVFGIYPEGTRTRDGLLHKGKTGVARLALATDVPIIPVGIVPPAGVSFGATILNVLAFWKPIHVIFGPPVRFTSRPTGEPSKEDLDAMTKEVMLSIAPLCGLSYRH